jgi:hypothetical protein
MKWSDLDPTEDWTWEFRGKLVLVAWGVAAVAAAFPELPLLLAFPLFPLGLLYGIPGWDSLFPPPASPPTRSGSGMAEFFLPLVAGWTIYLVVSLTATATKSRLMFFIFYMGLILLLVLNVRGCHTFMETGF